MKNVILLICAMLITLALFSQVATVKGPIAKELVMMPIDTGCQVIVEKGFLNEFNVKDSIIASQDSVLVQTKKQLAREQAKKDLFGDIPGVSYLVGMLFMLAGIFINTSVLTSKSIKANPETPSKFSWGYWWNGNKDRILRWIGILIMGFCAMRFSGEIVNMPFTMFLCLLFGLGVDVLIEIFRNLKNKLPKPV